MSFWVNAAGKIIVNASGKVIECDTCPCVGTGTGGTVETNCCPAIPETLNIHVVARISDATDTVIYTTKDYGVQEFVYTDLLAAGWTLSPEGTAPAWLKEFELWEASDVYPLRLAMKCGWGSSSNELAMYAASNYSASPTTLTRMIVSTLIPYECDPLLWEIALTTEVSPSVVIGRLGGYTLGAGPDAYARFDIAVYE